MAELISLSAARSCENRLPIVEALENRRLLSAAPVAIPTDLVGASFVGTLHLHFHAERGVRAHSASLPVVLQLTSLSDGVVSGSLLANGQQSQVNFTGKTVRRSFDGLFADGMLSGVFSPKGQAVHGSIGEVWNGDVITGSYTAKLPVADPHSANRKRDQTTPSTSSASSSPQLATAPLNSAPSAANVAPIEPILLPVLSTSFTTSNALNPGTTAAGVSASLGNGISESSSTSSNMTTTTSPTTSMFSFSPTSGIITITAGNYSFTPTSGLTPLNSAPAYTPSSGISSIVIPGLGT